MATLKWSGAASGDFTVAGNWIDISTGSAPASGPQNGDVLYFEDNAVSVDAGLSNGSLTLNGLYIGQNYTGSIGTDSSSLVVNFDSGAQRVVDIGYHTGPGTPAGSPLLNLDFDDGNVDITVYNTGTSSDSSKSPLRILNVNASSTLLVKKGNVSVATGIGETSTLDTITTSYDSKITTDADVYIGDNVTLENLECIGGATVCESGATTSTVLRAGTLTVTGSVTKTHALVSVYGGVLYFNQNAGIFTECRMYGGTLDLVQTNKTRTISALKVDPGATVKVNTSNVTVTGGLVALTSDIDISYSVS